MPTITPRPEPFYTDTTLTVWHGKCLAVLATMPDGSVDSVVTDPPYGLEFMGKGWDAPWQESDVNADAGFHGGGIAQTRGLPQFTGSTNPKCANCKGTRRGRRDGTAVVAVCLCEDGGSFPNVRAVEMRAFQDWCEEWARECLRVLRPGGHILAFGGTRTFHRLTSAIEDAGFEVRDSIAWLYGSGFPKSLDVSKAIDKAAGATRLGLGVVKGAASSRTESLGVFAPEYEATNPATPDAERWQGWGTALKPAFEPVVVARKPLVGTVAANVLAHGTGALNVDGCRVGSAGGRTVHTSYGGSEGWEANQATGEVTINGGRWPANVLLDESQAGELDQQSGDQRDGVAVNRNKDPEAEKPHEVYGRQLVGDVTDRTFGGVGGASRFFYVAKADQSERVRVNGVAHPTVKPLALMRWLVRLVTPPGGAVLEPFAGSGTTVEACILEGFRCIAIEQEADYLPLIVQRINRRRDPVEAVKATGDDGGLFDLLDGGAA